MATVRSACIAALEISIATVVLPVPTSPVNHMPRPASTCAATSPTYRRTSRTRCGFARSMLGSGSRSKDTSR